MGTGELRMIHSRVVWMLRPVERSMTVSAPQRIAHTIFSTSSSTEEVTAELPMLALIFTRKLRPMIIGSNSPWLMLAGMMARPRAISERTNSGVMCAGNVGAEDFAVGQRGLGAREHGRAADVLAMGDVGHLLGHDAGARVFELRDGLTGDAAERLRLGGEVAREVARRDVAVVLRLHGAACIAFDIAAFAHPGLAQARQAARHVDARRRRRCTGRS